MKTGNEEERKTGWKHKRERKVCKIDRKKQAGKVEDTQKESCLI